MNDAVDTTSDKKSLFPKSMHLLKKEEFDAVFNAKRSAGDRVLVVYTKPNDLGHARLGLVVSRKVGKANYRNRWKRLLREAFRLAQHELPAVDIICLPRLREEPSFKVVDASLRRLALQSASKPQRGGKPSSNQKHHGRGKGPGASSAASSNSDASGKTSSDKRASKTPAPKNPSSSS